MLPGTAFLELALCVGGHVGCGAVRELTLEAPLVFAGDGALLLQVVVGEGEGEGEGEGDGPRERSFGVYSRLEQAAGEDPFSGEASWTRHASGALMATGAALNGQAAALKQRSELLQDAAWPPPGASAIDLDGVYDALAEHGFEYGPAFQGLRAAWRRGEELFAEVALSSPKALEEADRSACTRRCWTRRSTSG